MVFVIFEFVICALMRLFLTLLYKAWLKFFFKEYYYRRIVRQIPVKKILKFEWNILPP